MLDDFLFNISKKNVIMCVLKLDILPVEIEILIEFL